MDIKLTGSEARLLRSILDRRYHELDYMTKSTEKYKSAEIEMLYRQMRLIKELSVKLKGG